ncbi:FGGY-family carbohydrate kinase [Niallia sp. HCP3S3_B10]|uniref:FGGY-family carbohydrate kinase n=1 Tax=Niallia sp. HCP3S3_B10 TaxID=3438944 RepID=UPI003F899B6E
MDLGTTNCKVALFELPSLTLTHLYRAPTPKIVSDTDETDFDTKAIWSLIQTGINNVTSNLWNKELVKGISIASVGESGVLVNNEGKVIGPSIAWFDKRGEEFLQPLLLKDLAYETYRITGIPPHTNYSLAKILYIKNKYKEANDKEVQWLSLANYFGFLLTGNRGMEASLASRTLAYNIQRKEWSKEILSTFHVDPAIFPEVHESGDIIGQLTEEAAIDLGLDQSTVVTVAGHDHMVGSLAVDLKESSELLNSTGTTEGLLFTHKNPILSDESFQYKISNGHYVQNPLYSYFSSLPAAGYAIEWLRKIVKMEEENEFTGMLSDLEETYRNHFQTLPFLLFIPHLRGSGPPVRSSLSKGLVYGITDKTTSQDLFYGLFIGLCFELKNLLHHFRVLVEIESPVMKVIGPAAHNPLWLQLKADILGCEIQAYPIKEAVVKGAAFSLASRQGWVTENSFEEKVVYTPNKEKHAFFQGKFEEYYWPIFDWKRELEEEGKN